MAHIDLTLDGFRETLRWARKDIRQTAEPVLAAETRRRNGEDVRVPRFAAYSVWVRVLTPRTSRMFLWLTESDEASTVLPSKTRSTRGS